MGAGEEGDLKSIWWTVWCYSLLRYLPVLVTCSLVPTEIRERACACECQTETPDESMDLQNVEHSLKEWVDQKKIKSLLARSRTGWGREYSQRTQNHFPFIWVLCSNLHLLVASGRLSRLRGRHKKQSKADDNRISRQKRLSTWRAGTEHVRKSRCYHKNKAGFKEGANRISGNVKESLKSKPSGLDKQPLRHKREN